MTAVTIDNANRRLEKEEDLAAGENSGWIQLPQEPNREALLAWFPGAGGTMTVVFTLDKTATVQDGTPEAIILADNTALDGNDALPSMVTAVKFTATTEDGKYRVVA